MLRQSLDVTITKKSCWKYPKNQLSSPANREFVSFMETGCTQIQFLANSACLVHFISTLHINEMEV